LVKPEKYGGSIFPHETPVSCTISIGAGVSDVVHTGHEEGFRDERSGDGPTESY
jgi:hypothetical protein